MREDVNNPSANSSRAGRTNTARWLEKTDHREVAMEMTLRGRGYLSFLLSPAGAGLTDILGCVETEPCDGLLAKEAASRVTGDVGGVGLLHSEWDREPVEEEEVQ